MEIQLTPSVAAFVQETLSSGRFASANDLVREALLAFETRESLEREDLENLRGLIHHSITQMDQGLGTPLDADAIKRKAHARWAERAG